MKNKLCLLLMSCLLLLSLTMCNEQTKKLSELVKFSKNDPFTASVSASHFYGIDAKQDNVVEGDNGTIIVFPRGCFKNTKGEIVEGNVKIELSESLSLDEMILSNLTTQSNGQPLETDGMIYFNATLNGEQLTVNKDNPVHIEIPTKEKKPGMMAYKGIRDEKGNMNWVDPKALDTFLVPIDFSLLDFLPEGFYTAVEHGMPYKNHQTANKELADSLYYSLSVTNGSELVKGLVNTDLNEPYYNKHNQVVKGKYTKQSFNVKPQLPDTLMRDSSNATDTCKYCGIDPAMIKAIKSGKYQHTLIATREFEIRLKVIFKTCHKDVLEVYAKNTGKNMYELDSMAEKLVHDNRYSHDFTRFYEQHLTNVKNADKYASLLEGYYEKQLRRIHEKLESAKEKWVKQLDKKNREAEKDADEYRKLLWEREKYRMQTYGFNWTEMGWINIDTGTIPKTWGPQRLEVTINNAAAYDRIYTYVVYTSIKSLYRLNTDDNELFYVGNKDEKKMLMPKHQAAFAIAIAYKGENAFLFIQQFETGTNEQFSLSLDLASLKEIKLKIKSYDRYAKENRISADLEYMDKFFTEQKRQKQLWKERDFIRDLYNITRPCRETQSAPVTEHVY